MARGWESKAVEEQIELAKSSRNDTANRTRTQAELKQLKHRESLMLERRRLIREMEQGRKKRYLMLLERTLKHVDAELAKLEPPVPSSLEPLK